MLVQAFRPEPAVERLDEGIVGRLARSGEVERDALLVRPQVQIPRHELRALIHPDGLGIADLPADPLQGGNHVFAAVTEARVQCRHVTGEGVEHGQHPDLLAGGQLVMHEVHRPDVVGPHGHLAVVPQFGLHPPLRRIVAQLHAQLPVDAIGPLDVCAPAFPLQQNVNTAVAIAHPRLTDVANALLETGLLGAAGFVVVGGAVKPESRTGPADRHRPFPAHPGHELALASRP